MLYLPYCTRCTTITSIYRLSEIKILFFNFIALPLKYTVIIEALYLAIFSIQDHFDQHGYATYKTLESLLLNGANQADYSAEFQKVLSRTNINNQVISSIY